jgi:hypothetical protein
MGKRGADGFIPSDKPNKKIVECCFVFGCARETTMT